MSEIFEKRTQIAAPAELVFAWHERPGALEALTPPWERVRVIERSGEGLRPGTRVVLETRLGPLRLRWVAEHVAYEAGRMFRDVQRSGPFARWVHTHQVESQGADCCELHDHVEYALPFGALGRLLGGAMVRRRLAQMFEYRHGVTRRACEQEWQAASRKTSMEHAQ